MLRRVLREPLLHFFVLGALLFGLFAWQNQDAMRAPDEIVVDEARIEVLRLQFERVWQRPPNRSELDGLIENWIREEILYREGLALGLERDDPVVRRRIAQKVEFISDGLIDESVTDAELEAWLADNAAKYRWDPRYTLRLVYFDPGRYGERIEAVIEKARDTLASGEPELPGDSTLLPGELEDASASEIARVFGRAFADSLADVPIGSWQGPLQSGYGLHLVRIEDREPGRVPTLDEVRPAVERDVLAARRESTQDAFFEALRARYRIVLPDPPDGGAVASSQP